MENDKAKGEYRCLTPQEIGANVAMFRKMLDWKQLTLAIEAGVNERTVQRVERGEKVEDESLRKIAKALRLREPGFVGPRHIQSEEVRKAELEKTMKEIMVIDAQDFNDLKDAEAILTTHGYFLNDNALPEQMADQVAVLRDTLTDWGDIYSDLSHTERLNACRTIIAEVLKITQQGFKARYGVYTSDDDFKVAVMVFGPTTDVYFGALTQLVVPRQFAKLAIESLRG
jgi:transcriptional regulator with XRE-family HTH domain